MHFAIPDTQELVDESNSIYVSYNVHINGLLHCTLRYRQFHNLHEELVKKFGPLLPAFPPKKFFPLTANQQEERRVGLEKYLQIIGQTSVIYSSELFNRFFFNAQQELVCGIWEDEPLEVYIKNSIQTLTFSSKLNSGQVVKKIIDQGHLGAYFSLFIIAQKVGDKVDIHTILRKLEEFESPVITYKRMLTSGIRIFLTIRKNYWDIEHSIKLFTIPITRGFLIQEINADIANDRVFFSANIKFNQYILDKKKLSTRRLKYYGYLRFVPCRCDYPEPKSKVTVGIGNNELNLCILDHRNDTELSCKITRIRCWRITTLSNVPTSIGWIDNDQFNFELTFEYLFPDNKLQWITISSNQAILMSVCLQSMIDELVLKSTNDKQEPESNDSWVHIKKDEQDRIVMENELVEDIDQVKQVHERNGVQSNVQKLIGVVMSSFPLWTTRNRNNDKRTMVCRDSIEEYSDIVANNPFYMIGDDVL
ncbi:PREDICTED: sorting nexin-17 [Polistes canadensis]|uniref:sorting nexin-17 n=1 Tax=Polistes canadensis TaxID=91411 RepID=UPI000718CB14|nr:PREDICTED: sorting nexin-17 [Polistes canadensis]XP_014598038.1 PREDICTED: sorting nexin-17 [Polistes canadensis]